MPGSVIIIGGGFAGLSAASYMAKSGWQVTVIEKNAGPGGRARQLKAEGFSFDMGPSFYWMPDVFENYFADFGKKPSDYYQLHRLDPSYRIYWDDGYNDIPASFESLKQLFESLEPGSSARLDAYLKEAHYKYETGINKLVHKPGLSIFEFFDIAVLKGIFRLDLVSSIKKHIAAHFKHPKLRQLMEFPVLFLGALPEDTPALYSLMNYADIKGGTWYPQGGLYSVVDGMHLLAKELGVQFNFNENVEEIIIENGKASKVRTATGVYDTDAVISAADYHFTETNLLSAEFRNYTDDYWQKRVMAPSCLLYYVGLNKRLTMQSHHLLFFDSAFEQHGKEIYRDPQWPSDPLFYVSISSVTDPTVAPPGCENLVFLVPVAAGLQGDSEELRERYFQKILERFEKQTGESVAKFIVYKKSYSVSDFVHDYNSFRGNAYGLANTLKQTAIFKPSCRNKKVSNLFYTGQLTVPGPGVPPCLISGKVVAKELVKTMD